jgi:hypothetical protein
VGGTSTVPTQSPFRLSLQLGVEVCMCTGGKSRLERGEAMEEK